MMIYYVVALAGIGIVSWSYYTAREKGRNGLLWAVFAAVMYYVPTQTFSKYLYPELVSSVINTSNQDEVLLIGATATVILAFLSCGITCKLVDCLSNKRFTAEELRAFEEFEKRRR